MGNSNVKVDPVEAVKDGFVAIVTGGYKGLGYEVSKYLAFSGAKVIITGDDEVPVNAAILRIQADVMEMRHVDAAADSKQASETNSLQDSQTAVVPDVNVEYQHLDLRSLKSVAKFVEEFKLKNNTLDLLICNDGIVSVPQEETEDRNEIHFQVNYLSHFLLTLHMLPIMRKTTGQCRIVNISNNCHNSGSLNMKNIHGHTGHYNSSLMYANSMLYQVMTTFALHRRLKDTNIAVFVMHAGKADEEIKKRSKDPEVWRSMYNVSKTLDSVLSSLTTAINTCLGLALKDYMLNLKGSYFASGEPISPSSKSLDIKQQEVLWKYSLGCVRDYITQEVIQDVKLDLNEIGITKKE